jgi:hypothetical protein
VDGPIEEVTSGMPGSQLKMIFSEPLHEKTYPLPCLSWAPPKNWAQRLRPSVTVSTEEHWVCHGLVGN